MARLLIIALTAALAGTLLAATPAAATAGHTRYVDCRAGDDARPGVGPGSAWRTLDRVDATGLHPGDTVLFRRGTRCAGTLAPHGSGAPGRPIRFGAYGSGAAPTIDGAGAPNAIHLANEEYVELRDLQVVDAAEPGSNRRGIYVTLQDFPGGVAHHLVISHVDVHDVRGDNQKFSSASGGIVLEVLPGTAPSAFDDVQITGNHLHTVDREGIYLWTYYCRRPELGTYWTGTCDGTPWTPFTRTSIAGNRLEDIGGDGIVAEMTADARVEHNRLDGFNRRSGTYNAGVWTADSDGALFQYNEVSGGTTTLDGMAYDIDHATNDTTFQYNFSHDNAGGFLLLCNTATETQRGGIVRYNISQNDSYRGIETCTAGGIQSGEIYHNTIYTAAGIRQVAVNENSAYARAVRFRDNIFCHTGDPGEVTFHLVSGAMRFDANEYAGLTGAPTDPHGRTADPRFVAPGTATRRTHADGYRLRVGSPALATGVPIADDGGRDFYGHRTVGAPNRGAYAGPGIRPDA